MAKNKKKLENDQLEKVNGGFPASININGKNTTPSAQNDPNPNNRGNNNGGYRGGVPRT